MSSCSIYSDDSPSSLDKSIIHELIKMFDKINELVKVFRNAKQRLYDVDHLNYRLLSLGKKDNDSRQYNDPSLNDIR
jgi:hypothetical protein